MKTAVYIGDEIAKYGFPGGHPFGPDRHEAFLKEFYHRNLADAVLIKKPVMAEIKNIELFHEIEYIDKVRELSKTGIGYLDMGDTPAFLGVFEAASYVAGSVVDAAENIMKNKFNRAFIPIAGLHHAYPERASGFCVFNDCGIAMKYLLEKHNLERIAYVDIDAHHGDGVFYSFEDDKRIIFADIHQFGIFPGTGNADETGTGEAKGYKLNVPVSAMANDDVFIKAWDDVENFLRKNNPQFIIMQCGADSLRGDPITNMGYTQKAHAYAAKRLCQIADEYCQGRIIGTGGGGYNRENLANAWNSVVEEFIENEEK
ncbi:MAG: acetoin utilization protein AcuC [Spirochaetia bacterium]|nr:acetoin utilization protein AcuC [Spirochaetia bacterium]